MAILKTDSIVIRRHDLRETSLLVNFFTREFGKLTGELKGIRAEPKKFASSVELFSNNDIVFYYKKNSSVHLISQCDLKDSFQGIKESMPRIQAASVIVELLDCLLAQEDKNPEVFDLALVCLKELASSSNPERISTVFKIKILSLSGFKPHLDSCVSCGQGSLMQTKFSLNLGGLLCPKCFAKDMQARSLFRGTIATVLHIEKNDLQNNLKLGMNPQVKKELDWMLNAFLNYHLGKELKSQRAINKMDSVEALS